MESSKEEGATELAKTFPTEERLRQEATKKAGHVAKKKVQFVEQHHGDCE